MDRDTSGRINSLLRKKRSRSHAQRTRQKLPDQGAIVMEVLQESLESGIIIKGFRNAIRAARTAKLMGPDGYCLGIGPIP